MKLKYLKLILFTFYNIYSCDVCNVFEYANRQNSHYIGVFYRNRMFNGFSTLNHQHQYQINPSSNTRQEHEPESNENTQFNKTQRDFEYYQTLEIRANYAISQKFNLQVFLPYNWSDVYYNEVTQFINPSRPVVKKDSAYGTNGIGDIILMIDYVKNIETGKWKHIIKPGLGLKLPTGSILKKHNEGTFFHPDLQPGTGALDIILRANYLVTNDLWGFDIFTNYRICNQNSKNYTFGNRFNITTLTYYTFNIKSIKILPKLGVYTEFAQNDKKDNIKLTNTGGYTYFVHTGFDLILGKCVVQAIFQKPYFEYLYGDIAGNAGRLSLGLIYNFK
ncbi:MAG: hypothetical protein EAZ27_03825 [Cytophagales bacterium]|nr:MAG: hypothetical protein EAZ27_03825 [Cytophagales bacterium]